MLLHGPGPRADWRPLRSTLAYLQTDTDFASLIVGEVNAGLFSSVLNLEHRGKVSFHHAFALLDPLKLRQTDPGSASKLTLAPAQKRPRRPYLSRVSHRFAVFFI
jgi:hypothetical protein